MARRAIPVVSRILCAVCGLTALLTTLPYALLRGVDLPFQSEWVFFVAVLGLTAVLSLAVAVLPGSWIGRLAGRSPHDEGNVSRTLKRLGGFAIVGYLLALVAYLAPHSWDLSPQLMLILCPMYLLRMNFDPENAQIFLLLAPMNAGVYGAIGVLLQTLWRSRAR